MAMIFSLRLIGARDRFDYFLVQWMGQRLETMAHFQIMVATQPWAHAPKGTSFWELNIESMEAVRTALHSVCDSYIVWNLVRRPLSRFLECTRSGSWKGFFQATMLTPICEWNPRDQMKQATKYVNTALAGYVEYQYCLTCGGALLSRLRFLLPSRQSLVRASRKSGRSVLGLMSRGLISELVCLAS